MRRPAERAIAAALRRRAPVLAAALIASACAGSGANRPARTEVRHENGFAITEEVHVGAGVRADFERAVRLLEEERLDEGIALLGAVAEAAPDVTAVQIDLGIAFRRVDDVERAEASLERALELNPTHPVALNELGILYRRMGRFEKARESYERALDAYPDFHFARRNLAILCDVYLVDPSCAIEHYERYLQAVPDDEAAAMWVADLRNRAVE